MKDEKEVLIKELDKIEFLDDDVVENLNFYEAAFYLENLNKIESLFNDIVINGDNNG